MEHGGYRGRFAPSPTGPLHQGSLVAALGSWLDARAHGGEWLVRIEDVDAPRTVPGAAEEILRTLEAFGLTWDGPVLYQSRRGEVYEAALDRLREQRLVFPCGCTRKEIADSAVGPAGLDGPRYPGTCRDGLPPGREGRAWRLRVDDERICWVDRRLGAQEQRLAEAVGDFVLRRADGLWAYQLAVVVDDAAQGVTDVVRGADLLDSTARQIDLQRALGYATPRYLHLPVLVNEQGQKLSKQTKAPALNVSRKEEHLRAALEFLGVWVPEEVGTVAEMLDWGVARWPWRGRLKSAPTAQPHGG